MRIYACAASVVLLLSIVASTAKADGVVVASTKDTPQRIVDETSRRLEQRGNRLVAIRYQGPSLRDTRSRAIAAMGTTFEKAKKLYVEERYKAAIGLLAAEEERSLRFLLEAEAGRAVLVQLNLWLGCMRLASGNATAASQRFRLAHSLDSSAQLDPFVWPPDYVSVFSDATSSAQATGQVSFRSPSAEARVLIDGTSQDLKGRESTWPLPVGMHYVFVHAPGLARFGSRFEVTAGGVVAVAPKEASAPAMELVHDLRAVQPSWLSESAGWRLALLKLSGASSLVVVRTTGALHYDSEGRRLDAVVPPRESSSNGSVAFSKSSTSSPSIYKRWWVWAAVGAVVGGSVLIWATNREPENVAGEFVR